jgi:1A family penicillin-binding protein
MNKPPKPNNYQPYKYHAAKPGARQAARPKRRTKMPVWLQRTWFGKKWLHLSRRRKIFLVIWTGVAALVLIALFTTIYFAGTLGSKDKIMNRSNTGVTLLDRNGKEFYSFDNARSTTYVPLSKISPIAQKAVIASEDKDFYHEPGFSIRGILYAIFQNLKTGGEGGGGSTITQQLVKNALLSNQRSILRKYQELVLSVEIERRYSKDEILEMYLNSVYFGQGEFGIQDASEAYFGIPASQLDTAQAAMLIGVLPAPSEYSPVSGDPKLANERQTYVLDQMEKDGFIDDSKKQSAEKEKLTYAPQKSTSQEIKAPFFALMVRDELIQKYGEEKIARSGFKVTTSLDLDWQAKAEDAVKQQINNLKYDDVSNGAVVIEDPTTGEIRALVGSVDYNNAKFGKVNMATTKRQPGSSFKPITYGTGIENRDFSAASIFNDHPININGYAPKDYDLRYAGNVTMRYALDNSLNIPAVLALQQVGIPKVIDQAKKFGVTTLNDNPNSYGLSLTLGAYPVPLTEMTNVYATYANQGQYNPTTLLQSIKDKNGRTTFKYKPKPKTAISSATSYIMSQVMSDNAARAGEFGTSLQVDPNRPVAAKTGTTEDFRDAWTLGYTPNLAIGVWIGNNDNTKMDSVAGSLGAAPIWKSLMQQLLAGTPVQQFEQPSDVVARDICRSNGELSVTKGAGVMTEYFLPNTLPTKYCNAPIASPNTDKTPPPQSNNNDKNPKKQDNQTQQPTTSEPPSDGTGTGGGTGSGTGTGGTSGGTGGTGSGTGTGTGGTGGTSGGTTTSP